MLTKNILQQLDTLSNNLCLYYARLTDDIYQRLMEKALAAGHQGLKLSHALILPKISTRGSRIIDIAKSQGVSKQAIGQLANDLEKLSYIERLPDTEDKRSKNLALTPSGIQLIKQAAGFMQDVEAELAAATGSDNFRKLQKHSHQLFRAWGLGYPEAGQFTPEVSNQAPLIGHAAALANALDMALQENNSRKGHPRLKRSYWQILQRISADGVRINDLAEVNGISKQAISQLANEIEKAGYLSRIEDPSDKRAKKLVLTPLGEKLIVDTLASTHAVEQQVENLIGTEAVKELKEAFHALTTPATQPKNRESRHPATAEQLVNQLLKQLHDDEKALWVCAEGRQLRLSDFALRQLADLRF